MLPQYVVMLAPDFAGTKKLPQTLPRDLAVALMLREYGHLLLALLRRVRITVYGPRQGPPLSYLCILVSVVLGV